MTGFGPRIPQGLSMHSSAFTVGEVSESPVSTGFSGSKVKTRPPESQLGTLRRRRLEDAVSFADGSHRTTVVSAPAGYGKTTLLGEWARENGAVCAWLTLDPSDLDPGVLYRSVVVALQRAAANLRGPAREALLGLDPSPGNDPAGGYLGVILALERLSEPLSLVIDDLHLAGAGLDGGLLGALVRSGPPALHLVLSLRGDPGLSLAAQRLRGAVTDISAADLAFTLEETCELLSIQGFNGPLEGKGLWSAAAGWPVATTEGMVLREGGIAPADAFSPEPRRAFLDYVAEEILARFPDPLPNFILRATTRDSINGQLAIELNGNADGAMLLGHCLHEGIFLTEERGSGCDAVYSWQPLFAAACRAILGHRDPLLASALHRIAARYFQDEDASTCVTEALLGHDPRTAMKSIGRHWLEMILVGDAGTLEGLCLGLPFPWSEDPEILMVRSACRSIAGDLSTSEALARRALAGSTGLGAGRRTRFDINRALFELFVIENSAPDTAASQGRQLVDKAAKNPSSTLANGLFLLGRAEARSSRPGRTSAQLLEAATAAGRANGLTTVEVCAGAELALSLSVNGEFAAAERQGTATLDRAEASSWSCRERLAPIWFARGVASYWQNDLPRADSGISAALDIGSDPFPVDPMAFVYRVLVDCATADSAGLAASRTFLDAFGAHQLKGPLGPALGLVAAAKLREAAGDPEGAAVIIQPLAKGGISPLADVLMADLFRTAGQPDKALACVGALADEINPPYVEASGALTEALIAHAAGDSAAAHERLEYALRCSETESVLRPFVERRPDLLPLLVQHSAWGTEHDVFIAAVLAHHPPEHVKRREHASWTLSEREREVLIYMRSMLTVAEIADSLFVSVNTLKTHQRSIYRKLGVTSRRAAIRIAMERGLI